MNVNFSVFIDKILSGEKRQTIRRASPKWENVEVGEKLTLYTGLRTKECRKLGVAFVSEIIFIEIDSRLERVAVESPLGKAYLDEPFLRDLIERDGFDNKSAFFNFFAKTYKNWTNTMFVIRWHCFMEAKDER